MTLQLQVAFALARNPTEKKKYNNEIIGGNGYIYTELHLGRNRAYSDALYFRFLYLGTLYLV